MAIGVMRGPHDCLGRLTLLPNPSVSNFVKFETRTTEIGRGEKPVATAYDGAVFSFSGAVVSRKRPDTGAF